MPSGRKLLHCLFKEKFGTYRYTWTPPWKGDFGVERLFFKALEIEEWNDYEGAWSKELRQASKEIPSLEEIRLPVKIRLGEMAEVEYYEGDGVEQRAYRVAIEVISDEVIAWEDEIDRQQVLCIGNVKISWSALKSFLLEQITIRAISGGIKGKGQGNWEELGVRFYIWLEAGLEKGRYQAIGNEVVSRLRSFIRKRLSDYQALKRGFEES